jgi:hypothetical protein
LAPTPAIETFDDRTTWFARCDLIESLRDMARPGFSPVVARSRSRAEIGRAVEGDVFGSPAKIPREQRHGKAGSEKRTILSFETGQRQPPKHTGKVVS